MSDPHEGVVSGESPSGPSSAVGSPAPSVARLISAGGSSSSAAAGAAAPASSDDPEVARATRLFERWQKTFLGAIDRQSEDYVLNMLREGEALISSGALDLNRSIKPASGSTFLHTVAWFQKARVIEWLLAHGADPNLGNLKGNTPLHLLCEQADKDIAPQLIQTMLDFGADVTRKDNTNQSAIDKAKVVGFDVLKLKYEKGKEFLAKKKELEAQGASSGAAAAAAAAHVAGQAAAAAASASAQAAAADPSDVPPLPESERAEAGKKAAAVYRKLSTLFLGLEPDATSATVDDAIIRILSSNLHLVHHKLLQLNQAPNESPGGRTFLHLAVAAGRNNIAKQLLTAHVDPDVQDEAGETPLHVAMSRVNIGEGGGLALVAALLDAGASMNKATYLKGMTPMQMLPPNTSAETRTWIRDYKPQLRSKLTAGALASTLGLGHGAGISLAGGGGGGAGGLAPLVPPSPSAGGGGGLLSPASGGGGGGGGGLMSPEKQDRAGARALIARMGSSLGVGLGGSDGLTSPKGSALGLMKHGSATGGPVGKRGSASGAPNLFQGALASILSKNAGGVPVGGGAGGSTTAKPSLPASLAGGLVSRAGQLGLGKKSSSSAAAAAEAGLQLDELFSTLDVSETHSLPLAQVHALHATMHGCALAPSPGAPGCPAWLVQQVLDSSIPAGLCTRQNMLDVLSQLQVACAAHAALRWDVSLLDVDGLGALSTLESSGTSTYPPSSGNGYSSAAELVWSVNHTQSDGAGGASKYEEFLARETRTKKTRPKDVKLAEFQAELLAKPAHIA